MKFDISRQPLVPAFLTLFALAIIAAWSVDTHAVGTDATAPSAYLVNAADSGFEAATQTTNAAAVNAAGNPPGNAITATGAAIEGLAIIPPGEMIAKFQTAHPLWSRLLTALLILFAGMCTGRLTVRYNLYSIGTCLAIPLFAIVLCGIGTGSQHLTGLCAAALLALAVKNFSRACTNGHSFDALFRASCYLSLVVLVAPAALPLLLILPLAVLLFRRTLREVVVSLAGLLLIPMLVCYLNWGAGGTFQAPLMLNWQMFIAGEPLGLIMHGELSTLIPVALVILLDLLAFFFFLNNSYAVGNKARNIFSFNIGVFLFSAALLCGPAATPETAILLSVPSAILLPVLFVRFHRSITLPFYLFLLVGAVLSTMLQ